MQLKTKKDIIVITGKNKAFNGTPYEKGTFKIFGQNLSVREQYEIHNEIELEGNKDNYIENNLKILKKTLTGWEGLKDEDGNEIEFNEKNIELLFDLSFEFMTLAMTAMSEGKKK